MIIPRLIHNTFFALPAQRRALAAAREFGEKNRKVETGVRGRIPLSEAPARPSAARFVRRCYLEYSSWCHMRQCAFEGFQAKKVTGRILTAEVMNAHNTFEKPDVVRPVEFKGMKAEDGKILATIPPKSVVVLEAE